MNASSPDPRYFHDRNGLRPNLRYALRWPRRYLWLGVICRISTLQMFLLRRWDSGRWLAARRFLS